MAYDYALVPVRTWFNGGKKTRFELSRGTKLKKWEVSCPPPYAQRGITW
jgi:hypothetical protein